VSASKVDSLSCDQCGQRLRLHVVSEGILSPDLRRRVQHALLDFANLMGWDVSGKVHRCDQCRRVWRGKEQET
jgi:hypothetical protein